MTKYNIFCYVLYNMQPMNQLTEVLEHCADKTHCLFSEDDFYPLFPGITVQNLRMLLSRASKNGVLERVCKGVYLYPKAEYDSSLILFKVASKVRAGCWNYVSLETVLSECGIISQMPMGWITIMTTGRRGVIGCGRFGSVEFIHTEKQPEKTMPELHLDRTTGMFWASPELALRDMKNARRPLDLADTNLARQVTPVKGAVFDSI